MSPRLKVYDPNAKDGWRKALLILVCILAAAAAILLIARLVKSCDGPGKKPKVDKLPAEVVPTPPDPDIDDDDIERSPDSLTFQVNRRIILILQNLDKTPAEFVDAFRKVYTDKDKYILSSPDMMLPRFVLTLPKEEKAHVESVIAGQFPDFDLLVLPDSMFETDKEASDPDFSDAEKRWYFDMCGIQNAWDETMGSEDVIVAVIDGGFDLSHPEFAGKIVDPYNAVYHNSKVTEDDHGTHVASTAIGRADNGTGVSGIAPGCRFMPIQVGDVHGNMTMSAIIDGILYAISKGADVVNLSLGLGLDPRLYTLPIPAQKNIILNNFKDLEAVFRQIFGMGIAKGITFVLAGGNKDCLIGMDPMERIDGTIRVSAVQPDRYKVDFSNFGPYSDLSAPGIQIYNALPGDRYGFMKGTSMAAPIVSGCVALMKSKNPALTTGDILRILQETGIPSPSDVGNIVNFAKAIKEVPSDGTRPVPPPAGDDCDEIRKRYQSLLDELERLKREHPECITPADTLVLPPAPELTDISGLWKSTTPLYNRKDEEVTLYFAFNGTPRGVFTIVEPSGLRCEAPLDVSIEGDVVHIVQVGYASSPDGETLYYPYTTDCKPNAKTRVAECVAVNQEEAWDQIRFNLVRVK